MITVIFGDPNIVGFVVIIGSVVVAGISVLGIGFSIVMRNKKK